PPRLRSTGIGGCGNHAKNQLAVSVRGSSFHHAALGADEGSVAAIKDDAAVTAHAAGSRQRHFLEALSFLLIETAMVPNQNAAVGRLADAQDHFASKPLGRPEAFEPLAIKPEHTVL